MNVFDPIPLPSTASAVTDVAVAIVLVLLLVLLARAWSARRKSGRITITVVLGGLAASALTGYSADGSWRFAAQYLDMKNPTERILLFAAAELAMLALVMMARENLNNPKRGVPGTPGVLIKIVTGVQIIPAVMISPDIGAGAVRAFFGPILAALMWHEVLGIDLRSNQPDAESKTLFATLNREARKRIFAYLGVFQMDRTALDISQDRAVLRAARRIQKYSDKDENRRASWRGRHLRRRISSDLRTARVSHDPVRRAELMSMLAHISSIDLLADKEYSDPWAPPVEPEAHQLSQATRQQMRDAIERTREFRPSGMPALEPGEKFNLASGLGPAPDHALTPGPDVASGPTPDPDANPATSPVPTPTPDPDGPVPAPIVGADATPTPAPDNIASGADSTPTSDPDAATPTPIVGGASAPTPDPDAVVPAPIVGADATPIPDPDNTASRADTTPDQDTPISDLTSASHPDKDAAPHPAKTLASAARITPPTPRIVVPINLDKPDLDAPDKKSVPKADKPTPTPKSEKKSGGRRTRAELIEEVAKLDPDKPTLSPNYVAGKVGCSWKVAKELLTETGRLPNPEPTEGE
ncbi:hypothetical protein ABZ502_17705 [Streptomyces abikoensis]|uniref:hypothetical protein n=1 Tax=Streptomyces abikoensis TaxID=97398 RepID=UPI00340BE7F4